VNLKRAELNPARFHTSLGVSRDKELISWIDLARLQQDFVPGGSTIPANCSNNDPAQRWRR
jgi:hypothetical protein